MTLSDAENDVAGGLVKSTSRGSSVGELTAPAALVHSLACAALATGES